MSVKKKDARSISLRSTRPLQSPLSPFVTAIPACCRQERERGRPGEKRSGGSQLGDPCTRCHLRPYCCPHSEARRRERCLRQKGCLLLLLLTARLWDKPGKNSSQASLRRAGWLFDTREPHPLYSPRSGVTPAVRLDCWHHLELPVFRKGFTLLLLPSFVSISAAMTEERQPQSTARETTQSPGSIWGGLGNILDSEKQKS